MTPTPYQFVTEWSDASALLAAGFRYIVSLVYEITYLERQNLKKSDLFLRVMRFINIRAYLEVWWRVIPLNDIAIFNMRKSIPIENVN